MNAEFDFYVTFVFENVNVGVTVFAMEDNEEAVIALAQFVIASNGIAIPEPQEIIVEKVGEFGEVNR